MLEGYVRPGYTLILRDFNTWQSPVKCGSDVEFSGDTTNLIKKTKRKGTWGALKFVWEFLQFEALHRTFKAYDSANVANVAVPLPIAVLPQRHTLVTEFSPGYILDVFERRMDNGVEVTHYDSSIIKAELAVAYHLGVISKIKENEGIYHADYDLRHIIYDPNGPLATMFDLENARHLGGADLEWVIAESGFIKTEWFDVAKRRGVKAEELEEMYQRGRNDVNRPKKGYLEFIREVGQEFGITIKPMKGTLDDQDVRLAPVKYHKPRR